MTSLMSKLSSQTVPHTLPAHTSTLPSLSACPLTSLTWPSVQLSLSDGRQTKPTSAEWLQTPMKLLWKPIHWDNLVSVPVHRGATAEIGPDPGPY